MFGVPSVDVKTIGAGGGSIAWIDAGGFIHVGPQSAEAIPGPACYMRGGEEPTVTDANLVRGFLDPDYFVGGSMKLSSKLAEEIIRDKIANPLKITMPEAATLICLTCEQNMVAAIADITVRRGVDTREYVMVAGGAAAGVHAVPTARELGVKQIIIPKAAGVMSAFGILTSDVKFLFASSFFTDSPHFDYTGANKVLDELAKKALTYLSKMKINPENREFLFTVEARYAGQVWQLTLPLRSGQIRDEQELAQVVEDFHNLHERVYSVKSPQDYVEFIEWDVEAIGKLPEFFLEEQRYGGKQSSVALKNKRSAYFKELNGFTEIPTYLGDKLTYGNEIEGPAIIEEPLTTIVLYPDSKATVSKFGSYVIELY